MDSGEIRNLKDFLLLYNKISEDCTKKCVFNMTQRTLDEVEGNCVNTCTIKHMNVNHRIVELFAEINPGFQQRKAQEREEEFRKSQELLEKQRQEQAKKEAEGEGFLDKLKGLVSWN